MSFKMKDGPGRRPVAEMRVLFERSINETAVFRDNTPLGAMEVNGEFHHYMDPTTDSMWIGFAIGMRAADRLAARAAP